MYGYDAGVYYSAADALISGRVPYSGFVFLHPPASMLLLAPFAALGRLTTDTTGYVSANLFVNLLAAGSAVLVWATARRWGLGRRAAVTGGLFYAVWWGAINAEIGVRLEPFGSFFFLLAMLLLSAPARRTRTAAAGAALGVACCTKIWWTVPLLVVLGWLLWHRDERRRAGWAALGAAIAGAVVAGPFFALAGGDMWHRVVADQLGRRYHTQPYVRIQYLAGLRKAVPGLPTPATALAVLVIGVLFVAAIVVGWRHRPARLAVAVLIGQFVVLNVSPSFFNFYAGFAAGALALTVAAAVEPVPGRRLVVARVGVAATVVAALVTVGGLIHSRDLVDRFPRQRFAAATAGLHCVMTDSNSALILMNRLSDDLADGCRNWVDVTGHTYFGQARSDDLSRPRNRVWQRLLQHYLLSGDAVLIVRADGTGPSRRTLTRISRGPVLARGDGYVVYRVIR
jgi:hypothetical protein